MVGADHHPAVPHHHRRRPRHLDRRRRQRRFWLEADTGTEPLGRLIGKLDRYAALTRRVGIRYPVLFWLGSAAREEHLHRLLRGRRGDVLVATATHETDPAQAVWLPGGATGRVGLAQLPTDHGQPVADNPNFDDGVFVL